jgi:hypothetical protein
MWPQSAQVNEIVDCITPRGNTAQSAATNARVPTARLIQRFRRQPGGVLSNV